MTLPKMPLICRGAAIVYDWATAHHEMSCRRDPEVVRWKAKMSLAIYRIALPRPVECGPKWSVFALGLPLGWPICAHFAPFALGIQSA